MKVSQRMTPNPVTVTPDTSHREAVSLLQEHNIRRLPVLDNRGRLVGIVTQEDLLSHAPSKATTLSVYEVYTLLDKLKIKQIMSKPVFAVEESCGLSAAARFMVDNRVSALPVMRGEELVGIITETDIFRSFVEVLGGRKEGLRIDLRVPNRPGVIAEITRTIAEAGGNINSITTFDAPDGEHGELSIKEQGADATRLAATLDALPDVDVLSIKPHQSDRLLTFGG